MAKLECTMNYIDEDGEIAAEITAKYNKLDYAGVVKMQSAVVGSILSLGEQAAQAKAPGDQQSS